MFVNGIMLSFGLVAGVAILWLAGCILGAIVSKAPVITPQPEPKRPKPDKFDSIYWLAMGALLFGSFVYTQLFAYQPVH